MFNLFNKKPASSQSHVSLKIVGMHCTSCSLNIDDSLEEIVGVVSAKTSYAKSTTSVSFDPQKVTVEKLIKTIKDSGYDAEVSE